MDFIECEKVQGAQYCSDNDCNCSFTPLQQGDSYLYISQEVLDFRKDIPTLPQLQAKLTELTASGEYISVSRYSPILICKEAAFRRNLNMAVAKEDAYHFWKEGRAPMRVTPEASSSDNAPEPGTTSDNKNNEPELPLVKRALDVKQTAPDLPDVSMDQMMSSFSGSPLAELAKKMAQDAESNNYDLSSKPSDNGVEQTKITNRSTYTQIAQDQSGIATTEIIAKPKTAEKKPKQNDSAITYKKEKKPVVYIIIVAASLFILLGVAAIFLVEKFYKPAPVAVVKQTPAPEKILNEIPSSFFDRYYFFEDAHFKGMMSFTPGDNRSGEYTQSVQSKENGKNYSVHGLYSFSGSQVKFQPDAYPKEIQWILDNLDQDGNATFHDPSVQEKENARVFLRLK